MFLTYTLNKFLQVNQDSFAMTEVLYLTRFGLNIQIVWTQQNKSRGKLETNDVGCEERSLSAAL